MKSIHSIKLIKHQLIDDIKSAGQRSFQKFIFKALFIERYNSKLTKYPVGCRKYDSRKLIECTITLKKSRSGIVGILKNPHDNRKKRFISIIK